MDRRYVLKQSGIDLEVVERRVTDLFSLKAEDLYGNGRARRIVQARSVFCFWAARELGYSQKGLADRFSVTEPAITYAIRRGQRLTHENGYRLREEELSRRGATEREK